MLDTDYVHAVLLSRGHHRPSMRRNGLGDGEPDDALDDCHGSGLQTQGRKSYQCRATQVTSKNP